MCIQAGLVFICPLNICTCGDCLRLFCLGKNKGGCLIPFVPFKNVFYMVNTNLTCCMNIRKYVRSLLIDGLMDVHDLHSCVLLFLCLNYLLHPALCS